MGGMAGLSAMGWDEKKNNALGCGKTERGGGGRS